MLPEIKERLNVVLVDDEEGLRNIMPLLLRDHGIDVIAEPKVPDHWTMSDPDVVVLDIDLRGTGGTNGENTIVRARRAWPMTPIVAWSGRCRPRELAAWVATGLVDSFVVKGGCTPHDDASGTKMLAITIWQAYGRQEGRTPARAVEEFAAVFEGAGA